MPSVNDKQEIMELLSQYLFCLDEKRFDSISMSEIFTENAEITIPLSIDSQQECRGLKEIRAALTARFKQVKSSHHVSSDFLFLASSDNAAEIRCKVSGFYNSSSKENEAYLSVGVINFSVVLTMDGWRIHSMARKTRTTYNMNIITKTQEE